LSVDAWELETMKHALGLNRQPEPFRNHFCAGEGSTYYPIWEGLVAKGYATKRGPSELHGGDFIYHVTEAGRAAAGLPPAGRQ
jgi:DNA-binding PadR family transcriptional regulator